MKFVVFAVPANVLLSSINGFPCFRSSCQSHYDADPAIVLIIKHWFSPFSQFLPMLCYYRIMILVVFEVPANVLLSSKHGFRSFRSFCQCFATINQWNSLFSQFLPIFFYQTMQFVVFAIPANVSWSSSNGFFVSHSW